MSGGVEHHPDSRAVAVAGLVWSLDTSGPDDPLDSSTEVLDEDLKVHHLRLLSGLFGPRRPLVRVVALKVQTNTATRVTGLDPAGTVTGRDLPAKETGVETPQRFSIGTVERDGGPTDRTGTRHRDKSVSACRKTLGSGGLGTRLVAAWIRFTKDRAVRALRRWRIVSSETVSVLVQIYGFTVPSDAAATDRLGADLIGVVVDEGLEAWDSVDASTALTIARRVKQARLVTLSLSTEPDQILSTARLLSPSILHLARGHQMTTDHLEAVRTAVHPTELMVTVPVLGAGSVADAQRLAGQADYLLLDTAHPETGLVGATGITHDWAVSADVVDAVTTPVVLAGGLGPHNVLAAIQSVSPAGVDSETLTSTQDDRRRKDLAKVETFIALAKGSAPATAP